jgi:hypothetical protein
MRRWSRGDIIAAASFSIAVITVVATVGVPEIRCKVGLERCASQELYTGRILDQERQTPLSGAKVALFTQGTPIIIYTDTEGIYQFY